MMLSGLLMMFGGFLVRVCCLLLHNTSSVVNDTNAATHIE